jgi:hypothetical protein
MEVIQAYFLLLVILIFNIVEVKLSFLFVAWNDVDAVILIIFTFYLGTQESIIEVEIDLMAFAGLVVDIDDK